MKRLITDIYKVLYKLTRLKWFSLIFALVYITILNLITIQGLAMLMQDWLKVAKYIHKFFRFPYYFIIAFILLLINYLVMPPMKSLRKERQKKPVILPIIVYTGVSIILLLYIHYADRFI